MADRTGQQLGNYRLIRSLGVGGFAEVYLGEHARLGMKAAVKVLHTRLANHDEVVNFEKEARTIANLTHPHIVRVLDYDVEDNTPFLIMEYAAGGTLRHRHPRGTLLSLPTVIAYIQQIADALQYAHNQRVIHRDIKPENILLGVHDQLLLSDFGIALVTQTSFSESIQNMAGTMPYMAPEQIQGHPRPASDQYALGIVVYEWLSGSCPFRGSMVEVMAQHLSAPPPPLRKKNTALPSAVEQVVLKALEKDPNQRFRSVKIFAEALEQASKNTQVTSTFIVPTPSASSPGIFIVPTQPAPSVPVTERKEQALSIGSNTPNTPSTGQVLAHVPVHPPRGGVQVTPWKKRTGTLSILAVSVLLVALLGNWIINQVLHNMPVGSITEFSIPTAKSDVGPITAGPDGNLWFPEISGNKIGRTSPSGTITEFPLPTAKSKPSPIIAGPDRNLWFTERDGNKIARITPAGTITEFSLPTSSSGPDWITAGPDHNLWFTEQDGNKVGRISPSGTITEFPLPAAKSIPSAITIGPDHNLWFFESGSSTIGRITPGGTLSEFAVPAAKGLFSFRMNTGPDGNLWFTEPRAESNKIARITPSGTITEFAISTALCFPYFGITTGSDGNLWFTELIGNKIGRITPGGTITEFRIPTPDSGPSWMMAGSDGNPWFTEANANKIGRITPGGTITEFPIPTAKSSPSAIIAGPDGNLWFTEENANKIARISLGSR